LPAPPVLRPLTEFDFKEVSAEFSQVIGEGYSVLNLTKFLCGIYTPCFFRLGVKQLPYFGVLENYVFGDVKAWVNEFVEISV
jgi:ATP-dependent DNA helicase RecQ